MTGIEWVRVPKLALDWLNGEGPDPAGYHFGDFPDDQPRPRGAFWWRTTFKDICSYCERTFDKPDAIEPQAPDVEPVAWLGENGNCTTERSRMETWRDKFFVRVTPLYPASAIDQLRRERDRWKDTAAAEAEAMEDQKRLYRSARTRAETAEAENAIMQDLLLKATRFDFGENSDGQNISVVSRGVSAWAVSDGSFVLNNLGEWEREPQPSSRGDEFIGRTRFTFADAVSKARAALQPQEKTP